MAEPVKRLFFALWPDAGYREALLAAMRHWQHGYPARWSKPENLHLTLAFLGNVAASQAPRLLEAAQSIRAPAIALQLDRLEYWRKSQILCLTPTATPPELARLAADLSSALAKAGLTIGTRPFRPHLTLARAAPRPLTLAQDLPALAWQADALTLVESTRDSGGGSRYAITHTWRLG